MSKDEASQAEQNAGQVPIRRRAIVLSTWQRLGAASFGVAASSAGGVSVFVSENQAGSTALLLLGGVAFLIGLTGRVPDKISKDGVNFEPVEGELAKGALKNVLTDPAVSPETRETVAEAVREEADRLTPNDAPDEFLAKFQSTLVRQADAVLREVDLLRLLEASLPPELRTAKASSIDGRRFDAYLIKREHEKDRLASSVAVELAMRPSVDKAVRDLNLAAEMKPGGFVFVASSGGRDRDRRIGQVFRKHAQSLGVQNAEITFFDGSEHSMRQIIDALVRAADAAATNA